MTREPSDCFFFFVVDAESWPFMLTLLWRDFKTRDRRRPVQTSQKLHFKHQRFGVVKCFCNNEGEKSAPFLAVMLAANMASKVCIKYTALWMANAAQEAHFLIYQREKKFTNCSPTLESSWIVCAPLTTEAAKRLKHCNNASKLRNRRFKVTTEYSFSRLVAPLYAQSTTVSRMKLVMRVFSALLL